MINLVLEKTDYPITGGRYVVAATKRNHRAICWAPKVDATVLRAIFEEVDALGLKRPIKVYGYTSQVGETETFRFEQVAAPPRRGPMPAIEYGGNLYSLKSRDTMIPDLSKMERMEVLMWLNKNTRARGYSKGGNPLAGMGDVLRVNVK